MESKHCGGAKENVRDVMDKINYGNKISIRRNKQGENDWIEIVAEYEQGPAVVFTCNIYLWRDFTPVMRDAIVEAARGYYG